MINLQKQQFAVEYQVPYGECEWRTQAFPTRERAESMAKFYRSCGSPARVKEQKGEPANGPPAGLIA